MAKPVGGRGKTAPYTSMMIRIPDTIKSRVEVLKKLYFSDELEKYDTELLENKRLADKYKEEYLNQPNNQEINKSLGDRQFNKEELVDLAKSILKQKKSARISLLKLISGLVDDEITEDDLK